MNESSLHCSLPLLVLLTGAPSFCVTEPRRIQENSFTIPKPEEQFVEGA